MNDALIQETKMPLTKVLALKLGGDWDYNVTFEQTFQKQKLQTNDIPVDTFTRAIANVVSAALNYFQVFEVSAVLSSITFSHAESESDSTFSVELNVKPQGNQFIWLKVVCSKIQRKIVEDSEGNWVEGFQNRNKLNEAVDILEEEIKRYALGARSQKELPFEDAGKDDEIPDPELFNDSVDILTAKARNISHLREVGKN